MTFHWYQRTLFCNWFNLNSFIWTFMKFSFIIWTQCCLSTALENQGRNRYIFLRGIVIFPDFFPGVKCFFPAENSHFGRPKTNFRHFQKWQAKKKKKKKKRVLTSFYNFSYFHFKFFHLPFYNFPSLFSIFTPFPLFPCPFFADTSAKISRSEVFGGGTLGALCPPPPSPRLLRHCREHQLDNLWF